MNKINKTIVSILTCAILVLGVSCEIDNVVDPNNPSIGSVLNNANKAQLQSLVTGLETQHRLYFSNATQMFGSFGREVWAFFASDPRFLTEWLGVAVTDTYNDFFGSAGTYNSPYQAIRQGNILVQSVDNTSLLTVAEANGYKGYAKTIMAYQYIWPLMQQYQNGIRVDVINPVNPGPVVTYAQALQYIRDLLDEAYDDLNAAGSTFAFTLEGFTGFDSPGEMAKVNRAIAARLALYANDYSGAKTALANSFMNTTVTSTADLYVGPEHAFGNSPDLNNPLYYPLDASTNTILIAHTGLIEDALPNDDRIALKFFQRASPVTSNNLRDGNGDQIPGEYQDNRWATNTASIQFIRNEELILILAEAEANLTNTTQAVDAINEIRNAWGLADYAGGTSLDELIEEILFQRRYSLWAEGGHRWIDLRRTGKLDASHVDLRDEGNIFTQVAERTSEINWDINN